MRDTTFTLLKALAIVCVVASHAGAPDALSRFVFQFHVPAFFLCAGYFFNTRYLSDERTYLVHRVRGLYLPFVRYSIILLVLHNLLFPLGVLSESVGNATGGVLHPYTLQAFSQRLWSIVFNTPGYDEFLGGAFWFFRSLLLASVGFLVLFKFFGKVRPQDSHTAIATTIAGVALGLALWRTAGGLRITGVAQGGGRELLGVCFMALGFLLRQYRAALRPTPWLALACAAVTAAGAAWFPSSMKHNASATEILSLVPTALCGFGLMYCLSSWIDRLGGIARRALVYVGNRTLYIYAFHLCAFKAAGLVHIAALSLPFAAWGGHPVVQPGVKTAFWLLYTACGVGLPLLWMHVYRRLARHIDFSLQSRLLWALRIALRLLRFLIIGTKRVLIGLWHALLELLRGIRDILIASNPKEE